MTDVIFYEAFKEETAALKEFLPDYITAEFTWKTIQEHQQQDPPSKLICIRTQSRIPPDWVQKIDGIFTRSQGYDHLAAYRQESGVNISCGYLDNYCARAVAEQAVLSMLALLRKLKKQVANFNTFDRDGLTGQESHERNAFIIGVGHIGSEIVDIARGLRMNVKGCDIIQKMSDLQYILLQEGMAWADIVFCALPLTQQTTGMLDYKGFQGAKPGLIFINIARGEISPIEDLKRLLDEEVLGGLAMDVYPDESHLADNIRAGRSSSSPAQEAVLEVAQHEKVLFTPHNAFNTEEALKRKASASADAVVQYLNSGTFPCPVPSL